MSQLEFDKAYFKAVARSWTSYGENSKSYHFKGGETDAPTFVDNAFDISKFRFDDNLIETTRDGRPLETKEERSQRLNPPKSYTKWDNEEGKGVRCDPATGEPVNPADRMPKVAVAKQTEDGVVAEVVTESEVTTLETEQEIDIISGGGEKPAPVSERFEGSGDTSTTATKAHELGFSNSQEMFDNLSRIKTVDLRKLAAGKLDSSEYRGVKKADLVPKLKAWWDAKKAEAVA